MVKPVQLKFKLKFGFTQQPSYNKNDYFDSIYFFILTSFLKLGKNIKIKYFLSWSNKFLFLASECLKQSAQILSIFFVWEKVQTEVRNKFIGNKKVLLPFILKPK